ncbi:TPA: Lar family restriction alleviation protein [Proteus mirabilis]
MAEKTQKLKPCPFCGGKAKITGYLLYEIKCGRCRVTLPQRYESDAIAAWNRRAPQC